MIAYKGFNHELTSMMGNGDKKTCCFKPGETKRVEKSKTARGGFHCCENPFECLTYYRMDGKNRFFKVEAAGDIDEDEGERIACTQITLVEELTPLKFAMEGMKYIICHPHRKRWKQDYGNVIVAQDTAKAMKDGDIAIARGREPKVSGPEGSILGLIVEDQAGDVVDAKLFVMDAQMAGKWCSLSENRKVVEVGKDEKKAC